MTTSDVFVPPEWAEQSALWVGWPHLKAEWGEAFDGARAEIAGFIQAARRFLPVRVACGSEGARYSAFQTTGSHVTHLHQVEIPTGDIWLRDTGPILAEVGGLPGALCFEFNGWGGKFIMPGDQETAEAIAAHDQITPHRRDFVLEGGAVELDGAGRLLTTRQCLLNPNRNPGWDEASAEAALKTAFGVSEIIWLERGLKNDHTDGHIDNLARFIGPGHVLCPAASSVDDPNAELYEEVARDLVAAGLRISCLPSPGLIGVCEPASHMNFVMINGALLLPIYEDKYSAQAIRELKRLFPDREIIALPARHILSGGGSFHCMTREIPRYPIALKVGFEDGR